MEIGSLDLKRKFASIWTIYSKEDGKLFQDLLFRSNWGTVKDITEVNVKNMMVESNIDITLKRNYNALQVNYNENEEMKNIELDCKFIAFDSSITKAAQTSFDTFCD